MTTYFAFKLAAPVQAAVDELLHNLDAGSSAPQHELHTRVSVAITDEILGNAVEGLIQRFQGAEGAGILNTLLGLLKSTAHMLIRQLLGKTSNESVAKMAQHLRDRRVECGSEVRYGFALSADLAQQLRTVFADVAAGNGLARRDELHQAMRRFADLGVVSFYDEFVAPMDLGFIKRKAADLGRSTIVKAVHVAVDKLIPGMGQPELAVFTDYYGSMLVDA
jgi:hypothetical protein